jgi:uncharacterized protein (AIM24 family)
MGMDVVDYEIKGAEMQFVDVELDPGEAAVGEAGSMFWMDAGIGMDTVFGDGSAQQGGLFAKLLGAGKRLVTGESLFTTVYSNNAPSKQRVAFAAPYPGKILPMDLRQHGGLLICQRDAFLCAARGVSLGIALIAGGIRHGEQKFDPRRLAVNGSMLMICAFCFIVPAMFNIGTPEGTISSNLSIKEMIAMNTRRRKEQEAA